MNVIIIGGGNLGTTLAKNLADVKHDVTLVEQEEKVCNEVVEELNAEIIRGDGTDIEVLNDAKIDKADVVAAVTGSDETNLLICLVVKEHYPNIRLASKISRSIYKKIFLKAGITTVISPEVSGADQLEAMITEPDILDFASVHKGEVELLEFVISTKSKAQNKTVEEAEIKGKTRIAAVKRKNEFMVASSDIKLVLGDRVIIVVRKGYEDKAKKMFK